MRSNRRHVFKQAGIESQGSPEAALNQNVKNLIQKLGEAIHESVSESESIAGVVRSIRDQGFDVLLMLEATIGLNEVESSAKAGETAEPATKVAIGSFTRNDLTFLKSLRIACRHRFGSPLRRSEHRFFLRLGRQPFPRRVEHFRNTRRVFEYHARWIFLRIIHWNVVASVYPIPKML